MSAEEVRERTTCSGLMSNTSIQHRLPPNTISQAKSDPRVCSQYSTMVRSYKSAERKVPIAGGGASPYAPVTWLVKLLSKILNVGGCCSLLY